MTLEQYSTFIQLLPQIETTLKKGGASVPRPDYKADNTLINDAEDANDDEDGPNKKANIDATSDEDEG
jgi:hypothetical protein